jgi:hypothetical protein
VTPGVMRATWAAAGAIHFAAGEAAVAAGDAAAVADAEEAPGPVWDEVHHGDLRPPPGRLRCARRRAGIRVG